MTTEPTHYGRAPTRRAFIATVAATALAGCAGTGSSTNPDTTDTTDTTDSSNGADTAASSDNIGGGGGPPLAETSLSLPMDPHDFDDHVVSGGVPKDGIPSIDDPSFEDADAANSRLKPWDRVFGVERNGVAKAYPQYILVWHEICNDEIGGDPVSVTYCPLTGTVLGFERGDTTFGVSGRLVNNNLIMYDRGTEQWWPQVLSTTIPGPWTDSYTRNSLQDFRVVWTTWERWRTEHPDTKVLTEETGNLRNYGNDPYGRYGDGDTFGYYATHQGPMFQSLSESDRFQDKRVVIGARTPEGAAAFLKDGIREQQLMEGEIGDTPVLAAYDPALDTAYVYRNPDGAAFEATDESYVASDGTAYRAADLPLDDIHAFDAMWFAWSGFYPDTSVYE